MSKVAAVFALAAVASASYAPTYGDPSSSAAPVSSEAPVYSSDPASSSAWPASSSAPVYPASSSDPAVYDPSSSFSVSYVPSSSAPVYPGSSSVSAAPSATPTYPACWSACFAEAGITSEADLCGNVEVDKCIHDGCCQEESWAYWQWYDSYCPAPSSSAEPVPSSTVPVGPYSSSSAAPTPSAPVDNCWTDCFAEFGVTSEAELCGNDDVSKCIHDTCCSALDKAYWDWYTGYCVAASTTVYTTSTVVTPTEPASTEYTTTYEVTSEYSWSPAEPSSPATGYPVPPPAPAPYTTYPVEGSSAAPVYGAPTGAAPTATGYAAPSASQWAPVPATGAGAVTKPGVILGAVLAVAALF